MTIVGDPGYFYNSTYYNSTWLEKTFASRGGLKAIHCWEKVTFTYNVTVVLVQVIEKSIDTGSDFLEEGLEQCTSGKRFRRSAE